LISSGLPLRSSVRTFLPDGSLKVKSGSAAPRLLMSSVPLKGPAPSACAAGGGGSGLRLRFGRGLLIAPGEKTRSQQRDQESERTP